jgi:hypothetical protein
MLPITNPYSGSTLISWSVLSHPPRPSRFGDCSLHNRCSSVLSATDGHFSAFQFIHHHRLPFFLHALCSESSPPRVAWQQDRLLCSSIILQISFCFQATCRTSRRSIMSLLFYFVSSLFFSISMTIVPFLHHARQWGICPDHRRSQPVLPQCQRKRRPLQLFPLCDLVIGNCSRPMLRMDCPWSSTP